MSIRETTRVSHLGWPKAGDLDRNHDRVPIDFGNGDRIWVTDPSWARQLATAATVAANALEAKLGIDMLPHAPAAGERRPAAPEETGLMPAIPPAPPAACGGCGQCGTCQPQPRTDVRVAP